MSVIKKGNIVYLSTGSHNYYYDESLPLLGEGAMGIVYKGVEPSTRSAVAIKRVRDRYANMPDIRRRAHLEASLMFSHPNLVEMYGCCEVAPNKGPLFIISGFVDGDTINNFINKNIRQLPEAEKKICQLFMPIFDALSYIHQKKIFHLDIKPTNIMVEKGRNVRLMDLGIANVSEGDSAIYGLMGTPRYAAPEQFANKGNVSKFTDATDIYEAGVTLYELITNSNPFPNNKDEARKLHETLILPKNPAISDSVLSVLQKATAADPLKRYQKASEMKFALQKALEQRESRLDHTWKYMGITFIAVLVLFGLILMINSLT